MPQSQPPLTPTAEDFAYSRLIAYAALQYPDYQTAHHHRLIARKLEAVERGDIKRLMIFMPPRHGKSMLASEFFPAWYLGRNPDKYVIAASYAQELSDDFGRKVRNQLRDETFKAVFPDCKLSGDSMSARRFSTEEGGAYFAVGVGGPVTGRGAHLLLIDDPVKNREDADSETIRRKIVEWYTSTAYTRLMKGGAIVLIQTRWHEDDLSGWVLENGKHEGWEILNLPAISDSGEALWPEQYPLDRLEEIRSTIGPRDWSALYQQKPAPDEGNFFKREWVRWYDEAPEHLRIYGTSDYAVTDGDGDYTAHAVWGVDPNDNLYLLYLWRGQTDSLVWVEVLIELIKQFTPAQWGEESGQIIKSIGGLIDKRQREAGAYCYRKQFASTRDKATRAQAFRGRMVQGKVYLPKKAPWLDSFLHELLIFPAGKHDDQVDCCSLIGRMLAEMHPADRPPPKESDVVAKLLEPQTIQDSFERHVKRRSGRTETRI